MDNFPPIRTKADEKDIDKALHELQQAIRPVIVAGGGVKSSAAEDELIAFARKSAIPVATALNAKGIIPDDDPLSLGIAGEYSATCANRVSL